MKKIVLIFIGLISFTIVYSQRNITLESLKTPYTYRVNPAVMPESKIFVSIPILGTQNFQFTNRIAPINQMFLKTSNDSLILNNSNSFFDGMGKKSYVGFDMTNQLLAFGFKVKKNYFTVDISNRFSAQVGFGTDMLKFLIQGNGGDLVGKRASFDGLGASLIDYVEYGLGFSREWNDKLNIGGRIKFLSGVANLKGTDTKLGITTDASDYSLSIDGQANIKSSNTAIFTDSAFAANNSPSQIISNLFNFANFGMGLDFGATYKYTDKIVLKASVIDLGYIKWTKGIANYQVQPFSYNFSGINLNDVINNKSNSTRIQDTLKSIFKTGKNSSSYYTGLPTRIYLGGDYIWNKHLTSGATFYNEFFNSSYRAGLILSSTFSFKHWFSATLNYGIYSGSYSNVGVGLRFRGFYILTDNLIAAINYQAVRAASIAIGFNITVGKTHDDKAAPKAE